MSVSLARNEKRSEASSGAPAASSAKKTAARRLRVGAAGDSFEREADRVADKVVRGGAMPEWSFARVDAARIQRDPTTDALNQGGGANQQQAPKPNNYDDAAKKLGEAFLKTDLGKKLEDGLTQQPIVKDAEAFVDTLPGKIVVGAAATAAVSTLAATHQPLPVQIPEIPLDKLKPGLKVKLTYEGPVDKPTKAMVTFSYSPDGDKKKKEPTASQKYLAETAPIAASMDMIRAGMHYAPGSAEAKQDAEDQKNFNEAMARRIGALPGTGGKPLVPPPQAGQAGAGAQGWTFSPFVGQALDKKIGLQPITPSDAPKADDSKDKKKPEDATVQRKCACENSGEQCEECKKSESLQRKEAGHADEFAPPIVDEVLSDAGRPMDKAARAYFEPRFGYDLSTIRIHDDARAAESARAVNAHAYTVGNHIVFGAGRFDANGQAGRHLLAHELAHVQQQEGGKGALVQRQTGATEVGPPAPDECEGRADITKEFQDFLKMLPALLNSSQDFTAEQKASFQNEFDRWLHTEGGVNVRAFSIASCDKINSDLLGGQEHATAEVDPNKREIRLSKETKKLMDDFKDKKEKEPLAKLIETLAHEKRHVTLGSALHVDSKDVRSPDSPDMAKKAEYRAQEILATAEELAVGRMAFGGTYAVSESKQHKLRRQNNMMRNYVTDAEYQRLRAIIIAKLRERYGFTNKCDSPLTVGVVSSMDHNRWFECVKGAPGGINPTVAPDLHVCDDFCKTQPNGPRKSENEEGSDFKPVPN